MELKICSRCCMDGTAKELVLDEHGVCNFCHIAQKELEGVNKLNYIALALKIKKPKQKYDCLIGLSGGVDSSYALHTAVAMGLRPLCYTIDNGWNTAESDENILRLVETLRVPFFRYTIDLPKFKELQAAFLQAGLINAEIPTDHILMASAFELASLYGITWILSGGNVATESIMPPSWSYTARDLTHIKSVYTWATGKKLKGLPVCSLLKWNYYKWIKGIKTCYLLDYIDYNRKEAEAMLIEKYGFKSTGEKHEESVYTKWFQNFYLYQKFNIDKRKAHYSSMINSGQMTRDEAMFLLTANPVYPELGLEKRIMKYKKHEHTDFKTDKWYPRIAKIIRLFK